MKAKDSGGLFVLLLFFFLPFSLAIAAEETATGFPSKDIEIHELVETLRETHLIQELQLSEEKANAVIEKVRYARKLRKSYVLQRYVIENELDALLEYPASDQTKINNILQKLEIARLHYYQKLLENDEELRQLLTPEEQAKYVLFQRNFNKKLKEVIAKIHQQSSTRTTKQNRILRKQPVESVIRQPR
jgi:Spy/CpxP family protein refolding chaperone